MEAEMWRRCLMGSAGRVQRLASAAPASAPPRVAAAAAAPAAAARHASAACEAPFSAASHRQATRGAWVRPGGAARSFAACRAAAAAEGAAPPGEEEDEAPPALALPTHCCGCGVHLQRDDADAPGFFQVPRHLLEPPRGAPPDGEGGDAELAAAAAAAAAAEEESKEEEEEEELDPEEAARRAAEDAVFDAWLAAADAEKRRKKQKPRVQVARYDDDGGGGGGAGASGGAAAARVLCARCHSLRHAGRVKSAAAEAALPAWDPGAALGRKLALQRFRRAVVLAVVDAADFDGSLPRAALAALAAGGGGGRPPFSLVIAANKADLLPRAASAARLEAWVRRRAAQGGLPRPAAVHVVSAATRAGVRELLAGLQAAVGGRGDVYVVGAQNAGKSSLLNAMRAVAGHGGGRAGRAGRGAAAGAEYVTVSPLAGTTLGPVDVPGLLPRGCRLVDTPGAGHAHSLAALMTPEEARLLLPRRPLRPRTFRLGAGQTVAVGGVARVDVLSCPGATMYLTVWAADEVACHFGRTDGAAERHARHAGGALAPPLGGPERAAAMPALVPVDVAVAGGSWRESGRDVAIAGLGWVAAALDGDAALRVWAPPGVAVTTRDALLPDLAEELERPGFGKAALAKLSAARPDAAAGGGGARRGAAGRRPQGRPSE